jgi:iron complex transport system substrate-binding protein
MKRLRHLALAVGLGALVLSGCSTGSTAENDDSSSSTKAQADAFPVTIEHAFGSTTIEKEPKRVATLGYDSQDYVLSLGVVPVGAVAITYGGNEAKSTPWFDDALEKLGGKQPVRYDYSAGAPVEDIAKLSPDVILATNSGLTKAEYDKLSKLAPVVAYPGDPYGTPWQTSLEMIGKALGRTDEAAKVKADTDQAIADAAEAHPQIKGKSFIVGAFTPADTSKIDYYTPLDNRPRLLEDLGMVNAPVIEELSKGNPAFYLTVSAERAASLESDVFVTYYASDDAQGDINQFRKDKLIGQVPALKSGGYVQVTDMTESMANSAPSPLSIPYTLDRLVPEIAKAVDRAEASS